MNFDEFLYKFRFYIGGVLIVLILAGASFILWDKFGKTRINRENQLISELKTQNDLLRQQLSLVSGQQIAGASTESTESIGDKIDINKADIAELDKIPGIGPARAQDIITYRDSHDGFKTIEEIKNIKGIGDKTFESMKDLITVGE